MLAGGRAGLERWASEFFAEIFRATGKAVRIGHSCAAVTHHRPPSRASGSTASRDRPMKAEARRRDHASRTHPESEHLPRGNSRVLPRTLRAAARENFIAKMKRESGNVPATAVVLLFAPSS